MSFFQEISPIFKKKEIVLIERLKESNDVYTFVFKKDDELNWKAGQHGVFSIRHKKIKKPTRPFSVASAPSEDVIKISMRISSRPSEFKKAMMELKPGMKINMRGPIGPLYIEHEKPSLLIAGGIGITPFRAILKETEKEGKESRKNIQLLYIDSNDSYLYKDEFNQISKNTSIKINYFNTRDDLYREIDKFSIQHKDMGVYYLGGSKAMVDSVETYLKSSRISKGNIKKDVFIGL